MAYFNQEQLEEALSWAKACLDADGPAYSKPHLRTIITVLDSARTPQPAMDLDKVADILNEAICNGVKALSSSGYYANPDPEALTIADYEEVLADHRRLVRKIDVIMNGDGAAKQASLCDLVDQIQQLANPEEVGEDELVKVLLEPHSPQRHSQIIKWTVRALKAAGFKIVRNA